MNRNKEFIKLVQELEDRGEDPEDALRLARRIMKNEQTLRWIIFFVCVIGSIWSIWWWFSV